jgi:CHAD domain-containing protein
VDEAYLTVLQRYAEVDRSRPATIHQLRVAFKKFRYMVEAIQPCLPNYPEAFLEAMHAYQTQMGRIHDIQVFLEMLTEFAEQRESYDPQPVRRFYERLLAEALSTYLKNKKEVVTFWRTSPLRAFPWEAQQTRKES